MWDIYSGLWDVVQYLWETYVVLKRWLAFRQSSQYGTSRMTLDTHGLTSNYTMMFGQHSPIFRFLQSEMAYLLETHFTCLFIKISSLMRLQGIRNIPRELRAVTWPLGHQAVLGWQWQLWVMLKLVQGYSDGSRYSWVRKKKKSGLPVFIFRRAHPFEMTL